MLDASMTLADGRTLAYTDIGAPDGPVVLYFHGAPGSRLELVGQSEEFLTAGVRVITPDRPGYGGSSPSPGRTTADWAADVVELVDHLGIERFAVMGLSSGGPYTIACAALLGDRVTGAVVAAGNTDMSWPGASDGYLESELDIMAMDDEAAAVAWCEEHYGADGSGFLSGDLDLGDVDNAFLADDAHLASLIDAIGEAFRQGVVGYAHDITVQGRPWSFDPGAITARTLVVHGDDDRLVPLAHSERTAHLVSGAELRVIVGCGHLSLVTQLPVLAHEVTGPDDAASIPSTP
jgi:pimeloyl-ACP methyl ester carboxylesterase